MYKMVIVDDETVIREGLRDLINWEDMNVEVLATAEDGEEAFEIICQLNPDIIIADIRMPSMDGIELLGALRKTRIESKVIVVSGYRDFNYAQNALKLGAADYILKPVQYDELTERVMKCIKEIEEQRLANQQNSFLREELFKNLSFINNHMLMDFILGNSQINEENLKYMNEVNIYKDSVCYVAGVLCIDSGACNDNDPDRQGLINEIYDICISETAFEACLIMKNIPDEVIFVFSSSDSGYHLKDKALIELKRIDCILKSINGFSYSIGVGKPCNDFNTLQISYREAVEACSFRLFEEAEIYDYEESVKQLSSFKCITNPVQLICNHMKLNDKDAIDGVLKDMVKSYLVSGNSEVNILRLQMKSLLDEVIGNASTLHAKVNHANNRKNIIMFLNNCKSIEQIFFTVRDLIFDIMVSKESNNSSSRLVALSLDYISRNYRSSISMRSVAESLFISPNYFCKIFSEEIGESFMKYVTKYRLNIAKDMIVNSYDKIYEIAEKTGYADVRYFIKVFKENEGITPNQYRNNYS